MGKKKNTGDKKMVNATLSSPRSGKPIRCWVSEETGAALDRYLASLRLPPTLTRVVELAIQEFLEKQGFWPAQE